MPRSFLRISYKSGCTLLLAVIVLSMGCNAFMHGYTADKAINSYYLVTGDKHNFGDRRIKYNKGFYHDSQLAYFLKLKGSPSFIYEYKNEQKGRGIRLFYTALDSVFTFEEPRKGNLHPELIAARNMDDYEKQTYARLQSAK